MIYFNLVLFVLAGATVATAFAVPSELVSKNHGRIIGGEPADISEVPYQVSMRYFSKHRCGGSIVSEKFVVSAAHCVEGIDKSKLTIVAGVSKLDELGTKFGVKKYQYHEKYDSQSLRNDISVVEIDGVFKFTANIKSIKLPQRGLVIPDDTPLLASGWGMAEHNTFPNQLQKAVLKRVNQDKCVKIWENDMVISKDMMCVTDVGKSLCNGDSGGPNVLGRGDNAVLIGVASFVHKAYVCLEPPYTTGLANVIELRDWITGKTNIRVD